MPYPNRTVPGWLTSECRASAVRLGSNSSVNGDVPCYRVAHAEPAFFSSLHRLRWSESQGRAEYKVAVERPCASPFSRSRELAS